MACREELRVAASTDGRVRQGSPRIVLLAAAFLIVVSTLLLELTAQGYYHLFVNPFLDLQRLEPAHYYRASRNSRLGYELIPGFQYRDGERDLAINSMGLRGREVAPNKAGPRLAILGDFATFSIGQAEAHTLPRLIEEKLAADCSRRIEVLNLGVPGYGAEEIREHLQTKAPSLDLDAVVYLLNLNDFSRRNSIYEGADNGLYRIYERPLFKLPFFVRKAFYRWYKGPFADGMAGPTPQWYRWLVKGTFGETLHGRAAGNPRQADPRGLPGGRGTGLLRDPRPRVSNRRAARRFRRGPLLRRRPGGAGAGGMRIVEFVFQPLRRRGRVGDRACSPTAWT